MYTESHKYSYKILLCARVVSLLQDHNIYREVYSTLECEENISVKILYKTEAAEFNHKNKIYRYGL